MNSIVSVVVVALAVSDNSLGLSDLSLALSELLAADDDVGGGVDARNDLGLVARDVEVSLLVDGGGLSVLAVHGDVNSLGFFGLLDLFQDDEDQNSNDDNGENDTDNDDGNSGAFFQV